MGGRRILVVALTLTLSAVGALAPRLLALAPRGHGPSETCATRPPSGGRYAVTVCLRSPLAGATLSGDQPVSIGVRISGSSPGVGRLVATLDGQPLLTDFSAPYAFTLPTAGFAPGPHTLAVVAVMRDGFVAGPVSIGLTFQNTGTSVPTGLFVPTRGRPARAGATATVVAVGEGGSGERAATSASDLAVALHPNLMLYLGDVFDSGTPTEFANWYGGSTALWGRLRTITDPTPGRHDYGSPGLAGYLGYWGQPPHAYSVDVAGWHIASLDSTPQFGQRGPASPQYQWLANDLANDRSSCTLAFLNDPAVSAAPGGGEVGLRPIWRLLARHGVDLVLAARDRAYERFVPLNAAERPAPAGIAEFVVGTGGHGVDQLTRRDGRLAASADTRGKGTGVLVLTLRRGSVGFRYVDLAGRTADAGSYRCTLGGVVAPLTITGLRAGPATFESQIPSRCHRARSAGRAACIRAAARLGTTIRFTLSDTAGAPSLVGRPLARVRVRAEGRSAVLASFQATVHAGRNAVRLPVVGLRDGSYMVSVQVGAGVRASLPARIAVSVRNH